MLTFLYLLAAGLAGVFFNYLNALKKQQLNVNFWVYLSGALRYTLLSIGSIVVAVSTLLTTGQINIEHPALTAYLLTFAAGYTLDNWLNKPP